METSEQINELATALAKAQGEMKAAPKNSLNPHFRSKFADLADCMEALKPLTKQGLSLIQAPSRYEGGYELITRLAHSSGQWIQARWPLPLGKPQEMGSALTYGRRYSLALVGLVTDEDDDAEAASGRVDPRGEGHKKVNQTERDKYVSQLTDIMAQDIEEEPKAKAVFAVHEKLNANEDMYIAVADELATRKILSKQQLRDWVNLGRPKPTGRAA